MALINRIGSSMTSKNFDDFNNMFKGIDREDRTPDHTATIILNKVKLERNPSRLDDVVEWFDEGHFYKIRCVVDISTYSVDRFDIEYSDVSDIED